MVSLAKYIFTLFVTISCTKLTAQNPTYYIQHFNDENGLVQNSIKGIEIDKEGYLWLGTEMGLVRYDGSNFKLYNKTNSPQLKTNRILNIGLSKDGNTFVEFEGYQYYSVNNHSKLQTIPTKYQERNLSGHYTISNTYSIYNKCRSKYENGQVPEWALPDYNFISSSLLNSLVYVKGNYYYFNENRDLIAADTGLTSFRKINLQGDQTFLSAIKTNRNIRTIALIVSNNSLYVWCGIYIYKLSSLNSGFALGVPLLYTGNISNINCLLEIPALNMFVVGTSSDGFYIFQKQFFSTRTLKNEESNIFYAQAPYGEDGVLTNKGVLFSDRHIPLPSDDFNSESILKTVDGNYYLSRMHDEFESGVVEFDSQLHELRYIRGYNIHVNCFRQLKDGSIWVSLKGHLLGKIENNYIKWYEFQKSLPQGFSINTFIESSKNELWIGGHNGLVRMNLTTGKIYTIPGLKDAEVRCLYEDKRGTIWIGTYEDGYYAYYKGKLIALPMDQERFLKTAHTFLEDNSGNIWITTNRGLFQAQIQDLYDYLDGKSHSVYYYYYDKTAGFLTNEFNGGATPSGIILNKGMFSLPSVNGLVQFYPDSIKPAFPAAQIYVDGIIGDTTIFNIDNEPLSISHYTNNLQFYISSPYFGNDYNQSIEYRLENLGDTWYRVNKNGIIQFSKLPTGSYNLLLRKKAGFGYNNYITKELAFTVTPFFYETWLFKIIISIALLALMYSFFRLRIHFLSRQKTQLEIEVFNKTKEQEALIDHLETNILELEKIQLELNQNNRLKEELAMIVAHDLQSPLRFITSATNSIYQVLLKKDYYEAQVMSFELRESSYKTYRFVEDFTMWLSTQGVNFQVHNTCVNLYTLVNELNLFFAELLTVKQNILVIDIEELLGIHTDRQLLKIILRNIIDNANKHTHRGIIHITGNQNHSNAFITISDNGDGIKEEVLRKIQAQIKAGSAKTDDTTGKMHGHGYRFICQFCNLLGINVDVESISGKGTTVRLTNLKL